MKFDDINFEEYKEIQIQDFQTVITIFKRKQN